MKTVCVVGLGPAGISAVKELQEQGFEVTGYDAGKKIGGRWALDWDTYAHGAWKELHMNQSRHINEFSDFPWRKEDYADKAGVEPDLYGYFPHSTEAYHYLEAYASHFDLHKSMVLNTKVIKIEKNSDENAKGDWIVHTQDTKTQQVSQTKFNGLVLCLGRYHKAFNPLVKGDGTGALDNFSGEIIHSADFKSIEMAKGKRVLVVGSSVSGCDICDSIARGGQAQSVDQSMRHVPYAMNYVTTKTGTITDEKFFNRLIVWLNLTLPESMNMKGLQVAMLEEFPLQVTKEISKDGSLVPDPDPAKAGVTYSLEWVETLKEGKFTLRHGIQLAEGNTVTFTNGTTAVYDLIICGTGYSMDLNSILPQDVADKVVFTNPWSKQQEVALYKWTLVPNLPTIALCGAQHGIGAPFPCVEMNARWIGNVFACSICGKKTLATRPSEAAIAKGAAQMKAFREASPGHKYDLVVMAIELMAREMGLAPSIVGSLWNPSKMLLAYPYASYYRTDPKQNDPQVAAKAQDRFDFLLKNVPSSLKSKE